MKKNKRFLPLAIATVMSLTATSAVFAESRIVKVQISSNIAIINDNVTDLDVAPYISNGNTMIPLRFVSNALDISDDDIFFEANTKTVYINRTSTDQQFIFQIGNGNISIINNASNKGSQPITNKMANSATAEIKDSRTFIPFRELANAFELDIDWEANTKTVTLGSKGSLTSGLTNSGSNSNITTTTPTETTTTTTTPTETTTTVVTMTAREMEEEVVRLVNIEREKEGLSPLAIYEPAMELARAKSQDMVDRNYFSHDDPSGEFMFKELFSDSSAVAENIASGQKTPEAVMISWMNSTGHKANILNSNYKNIGVGYVDGKWTQMFLGSVKTTAPEVVEPEKEEEEEKEETTTPETTNPEKEEVTTPEPEGEEEPEEDKTPEVEEDKTPEAEPEKEPEEDKTPEVEEEVAPETTSPTPSTGNSSSNELTSSEIRAFQEEVVRLTNIERAKVGASPLEIFEPAMDTAMKKSEEMATENYFSHNDPNGVYMFREELTKYSRDYELGENLTAGSQDPAEAVDTWMNSPGHKANMLSTKYKYMGTGYAYNKNSDWGTYWAQIFLGELK